MASYGNRERKFLLWSEPRSSVLPMFDRTISYVKQNHVFIMICYQVYNSYASQLNTLRFTLTLVSFIGNEIALVFFSPGTVHFPPTGSKSHITNTPATHARHSLSANTRPLHIEGPPPYGRMVPMSVDSDPSGSRTRNRSGSNVSGDEKNAGSRYATVSM